MSNAHFVASPKRKCRSSSAGFIGYRERRLLSILNKKKLERVLAYMLDETEFLGPHGIRSLSRYHLEHPFVFHVSGEEYKFQYVLGESNTGMFGGNSNWPRMDAGQWTASTTTWAKTRFKTCSFSALPILFSSPSGIGSASKACRSRWRKLRCRGSRQLYDCTGALRDVVQNHLLQVLSNNAKERPPGLDVEMLRHEKAKS